MASKKKKHNKPAVEDQEMAEAEPLAPRKEKPLPASIRRGEQDKSALPWVEKYRPQTLSDLVAHEDILNTISRFIEEKRIPHFLFYGPPGTGKTTTVLAIARKLYGPSFQSMILELNASDERGIDVVREQIKEFAGTRQIFSSGPKLVILDEADQMTSAAQAALRRVIEKYSKNTRFCLICNYVSKIIPALQSRCTRFRFAPLQTKHEEVRLRYVIEQEKVKCTDNGLQAILKLSAGDMRKCLNILQATHMAYPEVNEENVYLCTGNPLPRDIEQILLWMLNEPFATAYQNILKMKALKGLALQDVLREAHIYVLRMQLTDEHRLFLITRLADLENNLAAGATEKLQLTGLVAAFQSIRADAA